MLEVQVGPAAQSESRTALKTIGPAVRRGAGSHAGSHANEQPSDDPDPPGQPGETSPRSRTDLNGAGRPHRNLRISPWYRWRGVVPA
jgi:hypothetical protein